MLHMKAGGATARCVMLALRKAGATQSDSRGLADGCDLGLQHGGAEHGHAQHGGAEHGHAKRHTKVSDLAWAIVHQGLPLHGV